PPPQMAPPVQTAVPQSKMPPQPSAIMPHWLGAHTVIGVHAPPSGPLTVPPPQMLGPPPPQISGGVHTPQLAVTPPQPSGCGPHMPGKSAHVLGVQAPASGMTPTPHWLGPPPPQNDGGLQVPQLRTPPQPSLCCPQSTPVAA